MNQIKIAFCNHTTLPCTSYLSLIPLTSQNPLKGYSYRQRFDAALREVSKPTSLSEPDEDVGLWELIKEALEDMEKARLKVKRTDQIYIQLYLNGSYPTSVEEWLQVGIAKETKINYNVWQNNTSSKVDQIR